jgi:hypothetical protein
VTPFARFETGRNPCRMRPVTQDEALRLLSDTEVVPCCEARMPEAKELLTACLDAEVPALLDRGECCGKQGCGCAPKLELLVRPEDVSRVAVVLHTRWQGMLEREGTIDDDQAAADAEGEPPCPACGHTATLVEGACAGCGLQLE